MIWNLRVWLKADKNSVNSTIIEFQKIQKAGDKIEKSLNSWADKWLKKIKKEAKENVNTIAKLNDKIGLLNKELNTTKIWTKRFKELQKEIKKTDNALSKINWTKRDLLNSWLTAIWWTALIASIFWSSSEIEQIRTSFNLMIWDTKQAGLVMDELADFSSRTPFKFPETADWARKLMSVAWVAQNQLIPTLTALWDIAASQSKWIEQTVEAFNDAITGEFERLKEFWIKASSSWDKVTFTFKWQEKTVDKTKEAIQDYLIELSKVEWISWAMEEQSKTLNWRISTLKDNFWFLTKAIFWMSKSWEVLEWGVIYYVWKLTSYVWDLVNKYQVWAWENPKLASSIWIMIAVLLSLVTVLGTLWVLIPVIGWAIGWLTTVFIWLRTALMFLTWPIWLIIWWITLLTWVVYSYREELWLTQTKMRDVANEIDWFTEKTKKLKEEQDKLTKSYNDGRIWQEEYEEAIRNNKKAMDDLSKWHAIVQEWLDIINDKHLNYKEKINLINKLKLQTGEYDKLINKIKELQWERLKDIRLQQIQLRNKISDLKTTNEIEKLKQKVEDTPLYWQGSTLQTLQQYEDYSLELYDLQEKQLKKSSKQISNAQKEIELLQQQEKDLLKEQKEAEKLIMETIKTGSSNAWWWGSWQAKWVDQVKEKTKELTNSVKDLEKSYDSYEDKIEKLNDLEKKNRKNALEWNYEIESSLKDIRSELEKNIATYDEQIGKIEEERKKRLWEEQNNTDTKVAERILEIEKEKIDLQKELKEIEADNSNANVRRLNGLSKETLQDIGKWNLWGVTGKELLEVLEISEKIKQLNDEEVEAKKIVNQEELEKIRHYDTQTEIWKILLDQKEKIKEIENESKIKKDESRAELEKIQAKLQREEEIYEIFRDNQNISQRQLENLMKDERFRNLEEEERNLILKLARKNAELTQAKDSEIALQQEIANETILLQNKVSEILTGNISSLSDEYSKLISQINSAIQAQKRLNTLNWSQSNLPGFSEGWYTWDGGKHEEAWVVHKWEYVVPQAVINKMPDIVPTLEAMRTNTTNSNHTYNQSRNINIPGGITVQNQVDLELFFDKMKWKM